MKTLKGTQKLILAATLAVISLGFVGCVQTGGGTGSGSGSGGAAGSSGSAGGASSGVSGGANPIAAAVVNVGVKNFDQINASFSVLTGVSQSSGNVVNDFNALKAGLPLNNDIKTFSGSSQTAVVKLAARYCQEAIANNNQAVGQAAGVTTRMVVLPSNLVTAAGVAIPAANVPGQSPAIIFSPANMPVLISSFIGRFWGRSPASVANADDAQFAQLAIDLLNGEAVTGATTQATLIGVCTAVLANANVISM